MGLILLCIAGSVSANSLKCDPKNDRAGFDKYNGGLHSFACNVAHCCSQSNATHDTHSCVRFGRQTSWDYTPEDYLIQDQEIHYQNIEKDGTPDLQDVEKIYIDRMDKNMNCATYRMQYQTNHELLKGNAINDEKLSPHVQKKLQQENKELTKQMEEEECRTPSDDGDVSQQTKLTRATMHEQCVYEQYLGYYQETINNNIGSAFANNKIDDLNEFLGGLFGTKAFASLTTREIREYQQDITNRLDAKMSLGRRSHEDALQMHMNANRSHTSVRLLEVVENQLSELRSDMEIMWRATLITLDKGQNSIPPPPQ